VERRKITFGQFQEAVKLLAEKKYPGDEDAVEKLTAKIIEGKGPTTHGVTVRRSLVYTYFQQVVGLDAVHIL